MRLCTCFAVLVGVASAVDSRFAPAQREASPVLEARQSRPSKFPFAYFDQRIDHFPESPRYKPHHKGTYKQRYAIDKTYYKPGGPVFLVVGGEIPLEGRFNYLSTGIIQILSEQFNGLSIALENRYYGTSNPFNTTTTDNLAYLTTEQTIADLQNFAANVKVAGIPDITAPGTAWIIYGGSLAGGQAAFAMKEYGDTIYGGIAGSGVTLGLHGYPQWYDPVQKFGPQDCMTSINGIVDKMDAIIDAKNTKAVQRLKEIFGLGALKDIRDFAETISWVIGGPLFYLANTWQELNWKPEESSEDFFDFCGNVTNLDAPANNTAIDHEMAKYTNGEPWTGLGNYAAYVKSYTVDSCSNGDVEDCFGAGYRKQFQNISNHQGRSFLYQTCTEFGAYQVAYPRGQKSLISRVLQYDYTQDICNKAFPKGKYNSIPPSPDLQKYNRYGGLNVRADRLAFMDGESDVWTDLTYHSKLAPQRYSTDMNPEMLLDGSGHHWDSYGILNIKAEPYIIREAHRFEIRFVKKWLDDFKNWKPKTA